MHTDFQIVWHIGWRHQAITWSNVDLSADVICGIHTRTISQDFRSVISKMCSEITF